MKTQIWMEGYAATGESSDAQIIWEGDAIDFKDAISKYKIEHPGSIDEYTGNNAKRSKYGIWGCRLFDNEAEARKSFG
jgi:hypothetical protein